MEASRNRLESSTTLLVPRELQGPRSSPTSSPPAPRRKSWGRLLRWLIGGAILAEGVWLLAPLVLYRTSVRASVTAPLTTVRIHQQGVVEGLPPEVGTEVSRGQHLFDVSAASPDRRPLDRIEGEAEAIRRSIAALETQIADLDAIKATLNQHFLDYQEARIARARKQADEQEAIIQAAESRLKEAEYEFQVHGRASIRAASSDIERTRAEYAVAVARNELEEARQTAARLDVQLEAAQRGYFVGDADGGQDRVASLQRCDEIEIQQAGLRAHLEELQGKLLELDTRLASEQRHLEQNRVAIKAPRSGVVWSSTLDAGSEVAPGTTALEIVDPGHLSIEAIFKEADAARIRPGAPVKARLIGSSQILSGRVFHVADPTAVDPETVGEPSRDAVPIGMFRAIIALDDQPSGADPANRYLIGSSAVVWTPR
ncbi:HlyD family secretion protein [Tautonia marina]|uniref:HlyD family secretion protein n=1 Tax=Tautonia marina TaxID=2653855 RepID=UPI0013756D30|nr:HlyD family efflux transporter periplasmic adaptor subunit [Tautonia marina]